MTIKPEFKEEIEGQILASGEVTSRDMMGSTAYMVRGRMFAFWVPDGLVAKLSDRARQEFVDRKVGALFQGAQGRGFGDWTRLQLEKKKDVEAVLEGAKSAYDYVRGSAEATPRSKAKKKRKARR